MEILQNGTALAICFFEVYMYNSFLHNSLVERKTGRLCRIAVPIAIAFVIFGINLLYNSVVNLLASFILFLVLAITLYKGSLIKKFFYMIIGCLIMAFGEFVMEFIFGMIKGYNSLKLAGDAYSSIVIVLAAKLISFTIYKIIQYIPKAGKDGVTSTIVYSFYAFPAASLLIYIGLLYSFGEYDDFTVQKVMLLIGSFSLLSANILLFFIFGKLMDTMGEVRELEHVQVKNEMETRHYERMDQVNARYDKILHNMTHYLMAIGNLARTSDNDKIIEVLDSINIDIMKVSADVFCDSSIINAMLSDKKSRAEYNHVEYSVSVEPGFRVGKISDYDLICMLGNLLDNALEAAEKMERTQGFVHIRMFAVNDGKFALIFIENNFLISPVKNGNLFATTKLGKDRHGIGITSVNELAVKYGGFLNTKIEDNRFNATLMLPIYG